MGSRRTPVMPAVVAAVVTTIPSGCGDDSGASATTAAPPLVTELAPCDGRTDATSVDDDACLASIRAVVDAAAADVPGEFEPYGPLTDSLREINDTLQVVFPQQWTYRMDGDPPVDADAAAEPIVLTWDLAGRRIQWWVCPVADGVETSDTACT